MWRKREREKETIKERKDETKSFLTPTQPQLK
jgi:hypothetical protein